MIKKVNIVIIGILAVLFLWGCGVSSTNEANLEPVDPNTLQSLSYNESLEENEYTVYIKEFTEYVPYIVLTDDYDGSGNCLLLKKHLTEEPHQYNDDRVGGGYYGDSIIDGYLNEEYIELYTKELQELIVETDVEITTKDSVCNYGEETEYIKRKLFILSYNELGYDKSDIRPAEGEALEYFNTYERRIGRLENGESAAWWLRTPEIMHTATVTCVSNNGLFYVSGIVGTGYYYEMGVRPAFCLSKDTKIVKVNGTNYIEADYNALDVMNNAEDRSSLLYEEVLTPKQTGDSEPIKREYSPNGFHNNICPALAIMMDKYKDNPDHKYNVVLYSGYEINLQEILFQINSADTDVYLNLDYWKHLDNAYCKDSYYYIFTANEINELVKHKIVCAYVGSGVGDIEDLNLDTTEGLLGYCELYGDGYVAK